MNNEHCIKICNTLLRGERSAIEAYQEALASEPSAEIKRILQEHIDSAIALEENVLAMGGVPDLETGAWGSFATTVQGLAQTFGKTTALESLRLGEKSGLGDYQSALDDRFVLDECKTLIRNRLLPRIEEHLDTLDHLHEAA